MILVILSNMQKGILNLDEVFKMLDYYGYDGLWVDIHIESNIVTPFTETSYDMSKGSTYTKLFGEKE